jgi:TonB-like protein
MKRAMILQIILSLLMLFLPCAAVAQTEDNTPETPVVQSAEMPLYPELARQARIEGTVRMRVTTNGAAVTNLTANGAHKLLLEAAEQNVRTWHFYRHKPQTFSVTFVYKLEQPEVYGSVNPTLLIELPHRVAVRTKMPIAMP